MWTQRYRMACFERQYLVLATNGCIVNDNLSRKKAMGPASEGRSVSYYRGQIFCGPKPDDARATEVR